jgi:hypothetical protein
MATFSPVCPEDARTASSTRGAPCPQQGRRELADCSVQGYVAGRRATEHAAGGYFSVLLEGFGRFTPMTLFG